MFKEDLKILDELGVDGRMFCADPFYLVSDIIDGLSETDRVLFDKIETIINGWNPEDQYDTDELSVKEGKYMMREYDGEICSIFCIIKQNGTVEDIFKYIDWWIRDAISVHKNMPDFQTVISEGQKYIEQLYALVKI